jgi:cytochrome c553
MKTPTTSLFAVIAALALLSVPGCSSDGPKPAAEDGAAKQADPAKVDKPTEPATKNPVSTAKYTPADRKAARNHMKLFCATCHGASGKGNGPAGAGLSPKPRDWTDAAWHATVTDEKLFGVIKDGGAKHGLSEQMAPNALFQDRPGVIWALVKLVRGFRPR